MPSSLKYYRTDPNKLGRGPGMYYHRGKGYYSKYSRERDAKILAKGYRVDRVGFPLKAKLLHTGDGRRPR